jgi:hypothetical protein
LKSRQASPSRANAEAAKRSNYSACGNAWRDASDHHHQITTIRSHDQISLIRSA